jgi:hypothetical protein
MEAKLRKKHDDERHHLQREMERQAQVAKDANKAWDDFFVGDRRRLIRETSEASSQACRVWDEICSGDRKCVY